MTDTVMLITRNLYTAWRLAARNLHLAQKAQKQAWREYTDLTDALDRRRADPKAQAVIKEMEEGSDE